VTAPRHLLLVTVGVSAECSGNQHVFDPAGPAARSIAEHAWFLFVVCGAVYGLVLVALWWAIARRRRASDDLPATEAQLTRTVGAAVAVTVFALVAITVSSVLAGRGLTTPSGPGAVTVDVIGHQYWWEFQYRGDSASEFVTSPNELRIPVGVPVVLRAISRDVIHSFWVPSLHGKRDLIPGQVTNFWIQAERSGVYRGRCAEFCGHQHAYMAFDVVAEPMETFQEWIRHQREVASEPGTDLALRGQEVFLRSTCVMCHTIRGTPAGSRVGPELTHVASRRMLAAATIPDTAGHLAGWVIDPQSVKPGNRMPATVLPSEELNAVLAYLGSLR
jgi:cytochrome c oxidase subunit 2